MIELGRKDVAAGRIFLKEETLLRVFISFILNILFAFISTILFVFGEYMPFCKEIGRYVADLSLIVLLYAVYLLYGVIKK